MCIRDRCAEGLTTIQGADCVNISYPRFYEELMGLIPVSYTHLDVYKRQG